MEFLILISLLLMAGPSSARLVMKNSLFIVPDNPSAFDPNLNSVVDGVSTLHTADGQVPKDVLDCDQGISTWKFSSANIATNENRVSFTLSPSVKKIKKPRSPISADKSEGVLDLLPKGAVTLSGPSPKVNTMVTEPRLSTSSNSPGVGHIQVIRPKSQRHNGHTVESRDSHGDDHVQQEKSNKRKLGSTPSPGGGH